MTSKTAPDLTEREAFRRIAAQVAAGAASLVMEGFRKQVRVSTKAYAELFTEYDVRSEEFVRAQLQRLTPEVAIVGEEQGGQAASGLTWFIDPIDGTINFIAGHPYFAVSIGLVFGDQPLAGAVVAPALGLSWSGAVGGSALRNGETCVVSQNTELSDSIIGTGFPTRAKTPTTVTRAAAFTQVLNSARDVRRMGAAAIDLCLVADGTTDVYWMRHLPHWDTSAGAAVVIAAGGTWDVLPGRDGVIDGDSQNIATNGRVRDQFLQLVQE